MRYQILCSDGTTDFNDGPDSQRWGDDLDQMIESAKCLADQYPAVDYFVADAQGNRVYSTAANEC
jgi:hypothetical protein